MAGQDANHHPTYFFVKMSSCSIGVYDCSYRDIPVQDQLTCTEYDGSYEDMEGKIWIVILSGMIMCAMAFGMGANDAGKMKIPFDDRRHSNGSLTSDSQCVGNERGIRCDFVALCRVDCCCDGVPGCGISWRWGL